MRCCAKAVETPCREVAHVHGCLLQGLIFLQQDVVQGKAKGRTGGCNLIGLQSLAEAEIQSSRT